MNNLVKIFLLLILLLGKISSFESLNDGNFSYNIEVYQGSKVFDIQNLDDTLFAPYNKTIHLGLNNKEVWVKFDFQNNSNSNIKKIIVFKTTHIDNIKLYKKDKNSYSVITKDNRIIQGTLYPYFVLNLKPHENKTILVNIKASQIPTSFSIDITNSQKFFNNDRLMSFINIFIMGMLFAVAISFFVLYYNIQEHSYLFFALFILAALYYLFSFTGLAKVYASSSYEMLDRTLFIIKLNIIIVLASLYTILFLKLSKKGFIYKLYIFIIFASIAEIIFASFYDFSYYFVLLISGLFAFINLVAGARMYLCGLKGARLYLIGAIILTFGIYSNIFSALNVNTIQIDSTLFMIIFAFAILSFTMAHWDRYISNKQEEFNIVANSLDKKLILDNKIKEKQKELKELDTTQDVLIHNMNTIIKNNLQTIVSMLKLQKPKVSSTQILEELKNLEKRLMSTIKTYSLFLSATNPNNIVMKDYLNKVVNDILQTYLKESDIKIDLDVDANLKLEDAIYIAISVTEYLLNLDTTKSINVYISLKKQDSEYQFSIKDNNSSDFNTNNKSITKSLFKIFKNKI